MVRKMELDRMVIYPGELEDVFTRQLEAVRRGNLIQRIWEKDPRVWSDEPVAELTDRLGWLDLPEELERRVKALRQQIKALGSWKSVVLLGMGGSSLAPEVFASMLPGDDHRPGFTVLDSTHPEAIRKVRSSIDLQETLFIVASKSGTTLETLSFFRYFWAEAKDTVDTPGRHFVAVTDEGSPLEDLAIKRGFARVFLAPADVGGRFSALCEFGLVPALLAGLNPETMIDSMMTLVRQIQQDQPLRNPAACLGSLIGLASRMGRDRLTIWTPESWKTFPIWLEQLIAESTGKDGRGIIPVVHEPFPEDGHYPPERVFIVYAEPGESPLTADQMDRLTRSGHPLIFITVPGPHYVGGEMFLWEWAIALAGAIIGIHPFNQPDVQLAKDFTRKAMKRIEGSASFDNSGESPEDMNQQRDIVRRHLKEGHYLGLLMFLPPDSISDETARNFRREVVNRYHIATTAGYGPRYLHSTGQLHKGGPDHGFFLQFIGPIGEDIPVPETEYTFGQLITAQAEGDWLALRQRGRDIIRVELSNAVWAVNDGHFSEIKRWFLND